MYERMVDQIMVGSVSVSGSWNRSRSSSSSSTRLSKVSSLFNANKKKKKIVKRGSQPFTLYTQQLTTAASVILRCGMYQRFEHHTSITLFYRETIFVFVFFFFFILHIWLKKVKTAKCCCSCKKKKKNTGNDNIREGKKNRKKYLKQKSKNETKMKRKENIKTERTERFNQPRL